MNQNDVFEKASMKTWKKRINKVYDSRAKFEDKCIENNPNLSNYDRDILNKYQNAPNDIYGGLYGR